MSQTPWSHVDEVRNLRGGADTWRAKLGTHFDTFSGAFLCRLAEPATSVFCAEGCGCCHRVIRHADGEMVAVCQCDEDPGCEDIFVTEEDLAIYELDLRRLAKALRSAFGLHPREAPLDIPFTLQFGAYADDAIPAILTVPFGSDALLVTLKSLAATLRGRFILFTPTKNAVDVPCIQLLASFGAGIVSLDSTVRLLPDGRLQTVKPPQEILSAIHPVQPKPAEGTVMTALALLDELDQGGRRRGPTHTEVFHLYCVRGLAIEGIAKRTKSSLGTVANRKRRLEEKLGSPLEFFRQHGELIDHLQEQRHQSKARYIHRKSAIYGDSGFDNEPS